MIFGSRVGKKDERERRLIKVADGVFVAPDAYRVNAQSDFFERSSILEGGTETEPPEKPAKPES